MSYINTSGNNNYTSELNSTNILLNANETFTGQSENVQYFKSMSVNIYSDVASEDNGLIFDFSTDGVHWGKYCSRWQ